ncbi:MAG: hypothetical protein IPK03_04980 [Bacteroidetes bacterium]|nr:hypothetical protein [Bacteroidota bacterium]
MGNFSTYLKTMLSACLILSGVQLIAQNNTESLNYCKNITTNGYTTGIGFSAMAFGGTTYTAYSGAGTQVYFDNMNQFLAGGVNAGSSTMSFSYTNTVANERVRIWVDWNKNGVFNETAFVGPNNGGELMHNSGVIGLAGTVTAGTINVPFGVPAGVYRLRIAGDVGGNPSPCALTTSGVVIDYQIVIKNATTTDAAITRSNLPANFASITNMPAISLWARNIGTAVVPSGSNVVIGYSVNGGAPTTATVAIASNWSVGSELAITSPTLMTGLVSGEVNRIQTWIETVNGVAPPTVNNDSLVWFTFFASAINNMSGSYTVDRTTTGTRNFPTIQHALNALQVTGVSGATTINVAANTYWENPNITVTIPGASAVNTVTIQGADTSNTIIRLAINSVNYYGVLLANCSFVTFRNFKIRREEATSSSSSNILFQLRATTSCNVRRNALEYRGAAHAIGGTASTSGNYSGLAICGATSNFSGMTGGTTTNQCNIDSNNLDFANYYGIISAVTTVANTNTFSRNTIINQYIYPFFIQGEHRDLKF